MRLCILNNFYVLRGAFCGIIELHHRRLNFDSVSLVESTAVGDQVSEELQGRHGCVESGGDIEIPVLRLAHHVHDELDAPLVCCIV